MKKILTVDSWSGFGGGQRVAFDLSSGLISKHTFLHMAPAGPFLDLYQQKGMSVQVIRATQFIGIVWEIRKAIREQVPDAIHAHGTRAAAWVRIALMTLKQKPKMIYTVHGFHLPHRSPVTRFILLRLESFLHRWTDVLVCLSPKDREVILKLRLIDANKIEIISNGVDMAYWESGVAHETTSRFPLESDYVIGVVSRLHPPKDLETVLRAFAQLCASHTQSCALLIVGDGQLRNNLENLAKELGIDQQTYFVGDQQDVRPFLYRCNTVVISTKWEGQCLVVLEAAACKKPVVISNFDGVEEVVRTNQTGLVFPIGSIDQLRECLQQLIDAPDLATSLGNAAHTFIKEQFSLETTCRAYDALYQCND
ncbi:MAG: glycosyltransferase [Candidatus Uhrbacteria bacterium]|nr:glycosyltransferase [Candidatus Uhrbacteria bacterium]